jgi:hypothetical protein
MITRVCTCPTFLVAPEEKNITVISLDMERATTRWKRNSR